MESMCPVQQSGSFRDLKALLAECEGQGGAGTRSGDELPYKVRQRTHMLCSLFLGGTWKSVEVEDLKLSRMKGGMSNMLFLCELPEGYHSVRKEPDKTLLRVYFNPETETHLVAESVIFTLLSERHLGPRLYGIFNGGRLEEYIPSRPLTCAEIRDPSISAIVAKKFNRIHHLEVPIGKEPDYMCEALERWVEHLSIISEVSPYPLSVVTSDGKMITLLEEDIEKEIDLISWLHQLRAARSGSSPQLFRLIRNNTDTVSDVTTDAANCCFNREKNVLHVNVETVNLLADNEGAADACEEGCSANKCEWVTLQSLAEELKLIRRCICRSNSPVVFCHNDLQEGNILLQDVWSAENGPQNGPSSANSEKPKKDLVFIDFEYASYNYRGFDFANHFCEWALDYTSDKPPYFTVIWQDYPTLEQQKEYFTAYLECENLSESERGRIVDRLIEETTPFIPVSHFFWGVWALLQVELSPVEFGFAEYGRQRLALYFQTRANMLTLLGEEESTIVRFTPSPVPGDGPVTFATPKPKKPAPQDNKFLTVK